MGWRAVIAVALAGAALHLAPVVRAQPVERHGPSVTEHKLIVGQINLSYRATAGLIPIRGADGVLAGDMSYVAYSVAPTLGEKPRPIAFVWNGGPGSNSIPLHYGAFGPKRVAEDKLKPNAASLLDVADLVFVDPMEAGFGRFLLEGNMNASAKLDTEQFAQFIEDWLKDRPIHGEIYLIGESYGVYRAVTVADLLLQHGIVPAGLVLISGYPTVGGALDPSLQGALRVPGYAAFAFTRRALDPAVGSNVFEVHDAALAWVLPIHEKSTATEDFMVGWPEFAKGLSRFTGISQQAILDNKLPIGSSGAPYAFNTLARRGPTALFSDISSHDSYDIRHPPDLTERAWISPAVVEDIREDLGLNLKRDYVGLEHDTRSRVTGPFAVLKSDGSVEHVAAPPRRGDPPVDRLAKSTVGPLAARWTVPWRSLGETPAPHLLENAANMRVFVAGGIFDGLFPCALGDEMARRDLAAYRARVASRCYAGGHMMYFEEDVAAKLSNDVRQFLRAGSKN